MTGKRSSDPGSFKDTGPVRLAADRRIPPQNPTTASAISRYTVTIIIIMMIIKTVV